MMRFCIRPKQRDILSKWAFLLVLLLCLYPIHTIAEPSSSAVTAFFDAVRQGNNIKLQNLIKSGADVNAMEPGTGYTALMLAAQTNDLAMVKLLLNHGALVDSPNSNTGCDGTPLLLAAYGWVNTTAVMSPRLKAPQFKLPASRVDSQRWQRQLLEWRHGYFNIVQTLIEHGADVNARAKDRGFPLLHAAMGCDVQTIQLLLKHGADVNANNAAAFSPDSPITSLMAVAAGSWPGGTDSVKKVKLLLAWGADINMRTKNGDTALTFAKKAHQASVVKVLEAELKKRKAAGFTPPPPPIMRARGTSVGILVKTSSHDCKSRTQYAIL